jgi:DNA repair exonuclease SbcCD ATPase subunit
VSKLYEAGGQYLDELEAELEGKRQEISKIEKKKLDLEEQAESLRVETDSRNEENQKLKKENARLQNDVSEKTAHLKGVQTEIDRFREKGFKSELMQKLELLLERGGPLLLKQIEDAEKHLKAMNEFSVLNRRISCLRKEVHALQNEKKRTRDSKISLQNQIDDLKTQANSFKDAFDSVVWLLKRGYTVEDIKALGYGLEFMGVEHDADLSISRLISALRKQKRLAILDQNLTRKEKRLSEIEKATQDTTMKSSTIEEVTLKSINAVKNASIKAIQSAGDQAHTSLTTTCEKLDGDIQAFINKLYLDSEEQRHKESELARQKATFGTELEYGRFYQAFFASDDFLTKVSLPWMLHLSHRLHLWISMKLPTETIVPPSSFQTQLGLMNLPYSLKTLAMLVCLGLETVSSRQGVPPSDGRAGGS